MFTGIIETQAVLKEKKKKKNQIRLTFELTKPHRFRQGESIAVDGVCLTVVEFKGKKFSADVIVETLAGTTLGKLVENQKVNIEHPLRMGDALGGHWVTGHVDGVGRIKKISKRGSGLSLQIGAPADIINLLIHKGSVAIDGISFTIQKIHNGSFTIGLIPHTARVTTLGRKQAGDLVNLENDLLVKSVKQLS